jgi:hypothetical protein
MYFDLVFNIAFGLSVVGWLALFARPKNPIVNFWICGTILPVLFAILYTVLCIFWWNSAPGGFVDRFGSLGGIVTMFNHSRGLLFAGYVHYLAFDLFIGSWMARRAAVHAVSPLILYPSLFLTLVFGPMGLLLFSLLMNAQAKWMPENAAAPRGV